MLKFSDDPVYENEYFDNMSDEDWEEELNAEDDYDGWDLDEEEEYE